jgi:hypothetical protein
LTLLILRSKLLLDFVTSTHPHRRYGRLQLAMALLLTVVMCWVGERTELPEAGPRGGPAVERSNADTLPLGKLADSNTVWEAAEADPADESDVDTLLITAAALEFAPGVALRQFDCGRELNDWRARSSISARGPPVV